MPLAKDIMENKRALTLPEEELVPSISDIHQGVDIVLAKGMLEMNHIISHNESLNGDKIKALSSVLQIAKYLDERKEREEAKEGTLEFGSGMKIIPQATEERRAEAANGH